MSGTDSYELMKNFGCLAPGEQELVFELVFKLAGLEELKKERSETAKQVRGIMDQVNQLKLDNEEMSSLLELIKSEGN